MTRLGVAAFFLAALALPHRSVAQISNSSGGSNGVALTGTVFSENGKRPIEHATLRLCDTGGNLIEQSTTTDSGEFRFTQIRRSNYILTIDAIGFRSETLHMDLSFSSDRGVSIYLKPDASDPALAALAESMSAHEMSMPRKARDLVVSGEKKLYLDKNAQAALSDFQQAVAVAPNFYEADYQIGLAYLTLGSRPDAEKSFHKSIEESRDKYGEPVIGLASLLIDTGDFKQSEKMIRHGLELSPNSWFGYYQLGRILFAQNELNDAQKSAEQARSLAPNAAIVYRLLSNIHLNQKNYPALLEDLDAYIKLDPDSPAGKRAKEIRLQTQEKIVKTQPRPAAN